MNYEIEGNRIKLDRAELLTQLIEDYGLTAKTLQEAFEQGKVGVFYKTDRIPMIENYDSMSEEEREKLKPPYLYRVTEEKEVVTTADRGETTNIAKPGDVVSVGKTHGEQYVIEQDNFNKYYAKDEETGSYIKIASVLAFKMDDPQFSVYNDNKEMFESSEDTRFSILAPWKYDQDMRSGCFLVCAVDNPQAHDTYFCEEKAFTDTYASPEEFNKKFNVSVPVPTAEEFLEMAKKYDSEKTMFLKAAQEQEAAEATEAQDIEEKPQEPVAEKEPEKVTEATRKTENPNVPSESKADDYWRTVASEHKENMYKNVIDAIPELAKESETITGAEKEKVVDEPEQSSQSKETIASKLKEFYTLTMTRLNAVFDPEIRDFSKQIKRFSEMSESGEIKSDPYGDLSDVQREQVDGIVRILSDNINGLGFSKDGRSVPNDEKIREFVAIAAGTYSYYADEKFSMNDAIESVAQAINKEFKDDKVLSSMRVSREGIELAKAFAAEVSGIQDVTEVKKTAKEFFRQNLSDTGYGAFNMESPERPTSLIKQNGRINIKIDPRNLTVTHSPETLTPDVKTGRFNPHHRTV